MIGSKKELRLYLKEDLKRNLKKESLTWLDIIMYTLYPTDGYMAFSYLKSLRLYEYSINKYNKSGCLGKLIIAYRRYNNHKLSIKYGICIAPNTIGYGFYIPHVVGGGIIINCKSMGCYCSANPGVIVGVNKSQDFKPVIGDYVALNIGCKVIGNINIGSNVIIGANAVVTKDVPSNSVAAGVPAKVIKTITNN